MKDARLRLQLKEVRSLARALGCRLVIDDTRTVRTGLQCRFGLVDGEGVTVSDPEFQTLNTLHKYLLAERVWRDLADAVRALFCARANLQNKHAVSVEEINAFEAMVANNPLATPPRVHKKMTGVNHGEED